MEVGAESLQAKRHAAYAAVEPLCAAYPAQAGALFQTYTDLKYAARWQNLALHDVLRDSDNDGAGAGAGFGQRGWAMITGIAPDAKTTQAVLPMLIEQVLDTRMLTDVFARLPHGVDTSHVLLAMMSNDSTVVYYKLSQGMVKPVN